MLMSYWKQALKKLNSYSVHHYKWISQRKKLQPLFDLFLSALKFRLDLPWFREHVKKALPWFGPGLTTDLRLVRRPQWHSGGVTLPPLKQATGPVTWGVNFIFPPRGGVRRFTFPLGVVQGVIRRIGKFLAATETVVVFLLPVCVKFPRDTRDLKQRRRRRRRRRNLKNYLRVFRINSRWFILLQFV